MKNDLHIKMMKKVNAELESVNKKLDDLYYKHLAATESKKAA